MHNYYPWLSNDVSYNGQFSPFHYPKPPPFKYSPNAYHHPFNYASHNPFLGTSHNPIQFHDNRYLRIHSNSLPGYWNPPPALDHPGNEEFRRRGNTIYIIKRRPRVRRKSRHRKTNYGSGGHTMHIRNNMPPPPPSGGEKLSYSVGRSCGVKPGEAQFVKKEVDDEEYEDEDESGSESEEEVVEEEYEEEYECPYAYVDSNGKINKLQNAPN